MNLRKIAVRVAGLTQPLAERPDYGNRSSALPSGECQCGEDCPCGCGGKLELCDCEECQRAYSEMYSQK